MNIYVKGKEFYYLHNSPVSGSTNLIVQGEKGREIVFTLNTHGEHTGLENLPTFKLWYQRRDGQGLPVILTKGSVSQEDNTFTLTWVLDEHSTHLNGKFVFNISAYGTDNALVWKSKPCAICIANDVEPEIIDPDEKHLTYDDIISQFEDWVTARMGQPNGIATLNAQGKVPAEQIDTSGLDNLDKGYYFEGQFYKDAQYTQLITPDTEKLYIELNTGDLYVYNGVAYHKVSVEDLSNYYTKTEINNIVTNLQTLIGDKASTVALENEISRAEGAEQELQESIESLEERKVDKDGDKVLSDNNYTTSEKNKLAGVEANAEVNIIEEIEVNGTPAPIVQKKVSITIPSAPVQSVSKNGVPIPPDSQGNVNISLSEYRTSEAQDEIDEGLQDSIDAIEDKIPAQATSSNQLADKEFVNSSITTNTATFRGTWDLVNDLGLTSEATEQQIATALASVIPVVTKNDYSFVFYTNTTTGITEYYDRYKYSDADGWGFEFRLNNSSFTAAQWSAINSGITEGYVQKILSNEEKVDATVSNSEIDALFEEVDESPKINLEHAEAIKNYIDFKFSGRIIASTTEPTDDDGANGDIYLIYEE